MKAAIHSWMRGALASLASMVIYAVPIGCYLALMLLVISMEEGDDNLSGFTNGLTQAVVLLSEGSGFATQDVQVTITPLLLTLLLVALIAALHTRLKAVDASAYPAGLIVWLAMNEALRTSSVVSLVDEAWLTLCKAGLIYTMGFLCAALPGSRHLRRLIALARRRVSAPIRRSMFFGCAIALLIIAAHLLAGLITVIVWIVANHSAMLSVFDLLDMSLGSRIITTIAMVSWLPNLVLWAVSWLFGAGFSIGSTGSFTLWVGQSQDLPPVPLFGLFPDAVTNGAWRAVFTALPFIIAVLIASLALLLPQCFHIRPLAILQHAKRNSLISELMYAGGSFCLTAVLVSLLSTLGFASSCRRRGQCHGIYSNGRPWHSNGLAGGVAGRDNWHSACFFDRLDRRKDQDIPNGANRCRRHARTRAITINKGASR